MPGRDAADYHESSYTPDVAACDSLDDVLTEIIEQKWPSKWPREIIPAQIKFFRRILKAYLDSGHTVQVDVRRMEGRELLACLIAEIIAAPNARLMARCVDFVFSLNVQLGMSETEIAELEGLTKATASNYCVQLKKVYRDGKPAPGMKSREAVAKYKDLRTGRSSRGPRQQWAFANAFQTALHANN